MLPYLTGILAAIIVARTDHALGDSQVVKPLVALIACDDGHLHLIDDELVGGLGWGGKKKGGSASECLQFLS